MSSPDYPTDLRKLASLCRGDAVRARPTMTKAETG
jgi:hypothetical protein